MAYHLGMQTWPPKSNKKKYKRLVRETVLRNSSVSACAIPQAEVGEAVQEGDIQEAQRRAMSLSYSNITYEKANLSHDTFLQQPNI